MPVMNGYQTTEEINTLYKNMNKKAPPIIGIYFLLLFYLFLKYNNSFSKACTAYVGEDYKLKCY